MYDLLITNGRVVDGTGNPWFYGDIGVKEGRIVWIGNRSNGVEAARCIDASNCVVAPGFVDIHSHSDIGVLSEPCPTNKLSQGITTEVVGQCGFSLYPVSPERIPEFTAVTRSYGKELRIRWQTANDFLSLVEQQGIGYNFVPLVGHGTLRINAMGFAPRPARKDELEQMKGQLREAMEQGAFGLSSGLGYPPGCFADTGELVELCKVVAEYGGVYATHLRNQAEKLLDSVQEAITIGERSGVKVNISHLKASGQANWGQVATAVSMITAARQRGVDIIYDFYPYTAANNTLSSELPEWIHADGLEAMLMRLQDSDIRARLKQQLSVKDEAYWSNVLVAEARDPSICGHSIAFLAEKMNKDVYDTVFDILIEQRAAVQVIAQVMTEDDVAAAASCSFAAVGSDAFAQSDSLTTSYVHPRNYGTFPRFLSQYVRKLEAISLEQAVRRITSLPAGFLGLYDRGLIRTGMAADLVVFDPSKIDDRATYEEPHQLSEGIKYVIVNGCLQYCAGKNYKIRSGQVVRREEVEHCQVTT